MIHDPTAQRVQICALRFHSSLHFKGLFMLFLFISLRAHSNQSISIRIRRSPIKEKKGETRTQTLFAAMNNCDDCQCWLHKEKRFSHSSSPKHSVKP